MLEQLQPAAARPICAGVEVVPRFAHGWLTSGGESEQRRAADNAQRREAEQQRDQHVKRDQRDDELEQLAHVRAAAHSPCAVSIHSPTAPTSSISATTIAMFIKPSRIPDSAMATILQLT